jgi:hypothetical protein
MHGPAKNLTWGQNPYTKVLILFASKNKKEAILGGDSDGKNQQAL